VDIVRDVAFYGLCPEGGDEMHDWAVERLRNGAGTGGAARGGGGATAGGRAADGDALAIGSLEAEEKAADAAEDAPEDGDLDLARLRDGVVEADLSLLGSDGAAAAVEARKVLRAWRAAIAAVLKLLAAQDGWAKKAAKARPRKADQAKVEKLTLAADKAATALVRARERAGRGAARAEERARREEDRARKERDRGRKEAERAERAKEREVEARKKESRTRKDEKMKRKQASFMDSFIKKATPVKQKVARADAAAAVPCGGGGQDAAVNVAVTGTAAEAGGEPGDAAGAAVVSAAAAWKQPFAEHGMPVLGDPSFAPVSRWLLCLVPFSSPDAMDGACGFGGAGAGPGANGVVEVAGDRPLPSLLSHARARRRAAERQLPRVLREHRRSRREPRHDRAPRFAARRANLRGVADDEFDCAPYKLLQFDGEPRPPFVGTMRRRSATVAPRRPFARDGALDYEYDSADDWEDEEPGESLSDDEKDRELEDAELKTLGMFGSDSEADDDDFLDRGDGEGGDEEEGCGAGGGKVLRRQRFCGDDDDEDEDGGDDAPVCGDRCDGGVAINVDALPMPPMKRPRAAASGGGDSKSKRPKRNKSKFCPPRITVTGPLFDAAVADPVLDQFPTLRLVAGACIAAYDANSAAAAAELALDDQADVGRKPRRKTGVQLDQTAVDDLARIIHANATRGRDSVVDLFLDHLRSGGFQLPTKAEVSRAVNVLATRGKKTAWHFKDPSTATRLGLDAPPTAADKRATEDLARTLCSTPITPPRGHAKGATAPDKESPGSATVSCANVSVGTGKALDAT
jgi:hypothetical protein